MPGIPHAIVSREGDVVAIVPESIIGQVMTSALIPNMGYRMECRPATEEEIYQLIYQLEQNRPPMAERAMRYKAVEGVGQLVVVIPALPSRVGDGYGAPIANQVEWTPKVAH